MGCQDYGAGLVVCTGPRPWLQRKVERCPTCMCRREMVLLDHGPWYGWELGCTGCGDGWSEDGRGERPFARGWRHRAATRYRKLYAEAVYGGPSREWVREVLGL